MGKGNRCEKKKKRGEIRDESERISDVRRKELPTRLNGGTNLSACCAPGLFGLFVSITSGGNFFRDFDFFCLGGCTPVPMKSRSQKSRETASAKADDYVLGRSGARWCIGNPGVKYRCVFVVCVSGKGVQWCPCPRHCQNSRDGTPGASSGFGRKPMGFPGEQNLPTGFGQTAQQLGPCRPYSAPAKLPHCGAVLHQAQRTIATQNLRNHAASAIKLFRRAGPESWLGHRTPTRSHTHRFCDAEPSRARGFSVVTPAKDMGRVCTLRYAGWWVE